MAEITTETSGAVRVIRHSNPPRHYLNAQGTALLQKEMDAALADDAVRAIVITGVGDVFVRHYDVGDIVNAGEAVGAGAIGPEAFESGGFASLVDTILAAPKPVIAAINGVCMGGGFELALACDIRVAETSVNQIGLPETRIGIFPGGGGTQLLPRTIGEAAALEFILRGRVVDAGEACAMGLVHEACPDALKQALAIAQELAKRPPEGMASAKRLVRGALGRSLPEGLKTERRGFHDVLKDEAALASMRDFLAGDQDITA